jgi:hypothetical protein
MKKMPALLRRIVNKFYYDPLCKPLNENGKWEHDRFDFVRYYCLYLLLNRISQNDATGDIVELGVHRGNSAEFIRKKCSRHLHLFDTFSGFDQRDSKQFADAKYFQDTSLEAIKRRIGTENVSYYPGYFPESAKDFPRDRSLALVHIDMDLYEPIAAALDYFYPQLHRNGYMVVHDYNNIKITSKPGTAGRKKRWMNSSRARVRPSWNCPTNFAAW